MGGNKKVLLHECKRHTACCIASACYAGREGGYPIQSWWWCGGTPSSHGGGTLGMPHHQDLAGGYLSSHGGGWGGYLGTPNHPDLTRGIFHPVMVGVPQVPPTIQTWPGGFPIQSLGGTCITPHHPDLAGRYPKYPPPPPSRPGMGYPPDLGHGTSCYWDLGWGTPQTWNGVHHPPNLEQGTPHPDLGSLTPPLLKEVNMLYILTDNANIANTFVRYIISICDRITIAILHHIWRPNFYDVMNDDLFNTCMFVRISTLH